MVDQTVLQRSLRIDHVASHEQFECTAFSDQLHQPLRAPITRYETKAYFGLPKLCVFAGNPEMTGHGQFTSTPQCKTIYSRHNRFAAVFKFEKYVLPRARQVQSFGTA